MSLSDLTHAAMVARRDAKAANDRLNLAREALGLAEDEREATRERADTLEHAVLRVLRGDATVEPYGEIHIVVRAPGAEKALPLAFDSAGICTFPEET